MWSGGIVDSADTLRTKRLKFVALFPDMLLAYRVVQRALVANIIFYIPEIVLDSKYRLDPP